MVDFEALLAPVPGLDPCGPNLEYDPAFLALEWAARGRPEQRLGAAVMAAQAPDWRRVESMCRELLQRTKDLRVARLFIQARLRQDGLEGLVQGLQLVQGLVERFGVSFGAFDRPAPTHPRCDGNDHEEWIQVVNALGVEGEGGLLSDVRQLVLGAGAASLLVRDVAQAPGAGGVPANRVAAALRDELSRHPNLVQWLDDGMAACRAVNDVFEQAVWGSAPLWEVQRLLERLRWAALELGPPDDGGPQPEAAAPAPHPAFEWAPLPRIDFDALTAALSADEPCGPDLEYDSGWVALEAALAGRPEVQYGAYVVPAAGPDWRAVMSLTLERLTLTRDLRVAALFARAATRLHGLEGAAAGLQLIARLFGEHGDRLHPRPDPSADEWAWARAKTMEQLDSPDGLVGDLEQLGTQGLADPSFARDALLWAWRVADEIVRLQGYETESSGLGRLQALLEDLCAGNDKGQPEVVASAELREIDALCAPLAGDEPCGPDLEYDVRMDELKEALKSRRVGPDQTLMPPAASDFERAERLALELFNDTRDLRVAVALTRVWTYRNGMAGLLAGLKLIDRLLEAWGDDLHPRPDREDVDWYWYRRHALDVLSSTEGLVGDMRRQTWPLPTARLRELRGTLRSIRRGLQLRPDRQPDPFAGLAAELFRMPVLQTGTRRGAVAQVCETAIAAVTPPPGLAAALEALCAWADAAGIDALRVGARAERLVARRFSDLVHDSAAAPPATP